MVSSMKKRLKGQVSRSALIKRASLILLLFLVAASVSYPKGANWVIDRFNDVTSLKVRHVNYPIVLGLDLQGGTHLEYAADLSEVPEGERGDAMEGVRDLIERRVNQMGVSEPLVQTTRAGEQYRLTVELAGIRDVNEAIQMIGETPILEFREENPEAGREPTEEELAQLEEENKVIKEEAQGYLERVQNGEDLSALAREVSDDAESAYRGGDMGWLIENQGSPKLIEYFQDREPGLAPELIDDGVRYYIARLDDKRDAGTEVKASHILFQWADAASSQTSSTKEEARAKAESVLAELTPENFAERASEYSEEPGAGQSAGELGWFGPGAMVAPFEEATFALGENEISGIVETDFGFHIIHKTGERPRRDVKVTAIVVDQKKASDLINSEPWRRTELTGKQLNRAILDFDPQTGAPIVTLDFDGEGTKLFAELTKNNIGKPIAIFLDGEPISIPTVQQEIPSGQAVISGSFTIDEAKQLAQRLQAGALPVPIEIIAQQSVGPVLGAESVARSIQAGLYGFLFVILFMILIYRLPGLVSVFALAFYGALIFAVFKLVPVTLSLSGIAGFILSLGIVIDANVLIFERLKEELKTDKPMMAAVDEAFRRAWTSIRDGNVTTLIVCFVLYTFTSSLIKGFALTLGIGILLSMFTAIVVTRTILKLLVATPLSRQLPWIFLQGKKQ
ncbi:protein translocase subunit SecD [Candidatus Uhrbacteria bacterium]|nr:protein translocase subunit SecD [Candidatus Uhrbacteria bacterium]MBD3284320.1 protein translocase subunit SecD [Candidatus Uhrbacteria bacterium]